ncbi:hypothetical protein XENTR_v10015126 [Xenopus tropicalis]|nr:hypothetical protein XENTR_v10015126 [Xenopus tropicalis]
MMLIAVLCLSVLQRASAAAVFPFSSLSTRNATNRQKIVDIHNAYRRSANPTASNMLKMSWSIEAENNAKNWATTCNQYHSQPAARQIANITCGENLFMSSYPASWEEVIQSLHSEYDNFEYGVGAKAVGLVIGHYTQVMWYKSYRIGCYCTECPNDGVRLKYYYVCQYYPAGNYADRINYPYKSGPSCADCPDACDNGLCTNPCPYEDQYSNCDDLASGDQCDTYQIVKEGCPGSCLCKNNEII